MKAQKSTPKYKALFGKGCIQDARLQFMQANNKQKPQQNESKINVKHVWTCVRVTAERCHVSAVAHIDPSQHALYLSHVTHKLLEHWNALNLLIYHLIVEHNYWWFVSAFSDCSIFMLVLFKQECCCFAQIVRSMHVIHLICNYYVCTLHTMYLNLQDKRPKECEIKES